MVLGQLQLPSSTASGRRYVAHQIVLLHRKSWSCWTARTPVSRRCAVAYHFSRYPDQPANWLVLLHALEKRMKRVRGRLSGTCPRQRYRLFRRCYGRCLRCRTVRLSDRKIHGTLIAGTDTLRSCHRLPHARLGVRLSGAIFSVTQRVVSSTDIPSWISGSADLGASLKPRYGYRP